MPLQYGVRRAHLCTGAVFIFNQHKYPAGRGYGYVGVSRFRSRAGCFLYGKLWRADFLPVGEEQEEEVLDRGYLSESDDSDEGAGMWQASEGRSGIFHDSESDSDEEGGEDDSGGE